MQAWVAVQRWLELEDGEELVLECREDLAILTEKGVTLEQVKARSERLTLTTAWGSLAAHAEGFVELHGGGKLTPKLVFSATARFGTRPGGSGSKALREWHLDASRPEVIKEVREKLRADPGAGAKEAKRAQAERRKMAADYLDTNQLWEEFLDSVRWEPELPTLRGLEDRVTELVSLRVPGDGRLQARALLAEILERSSRSELGERRIDAANREASLAKTDEAIRASGNQIVLRFLEEVHDWTSRLPALFAESARVERDKDAQNRLELKSAELPEGEAGRLPSNLLKANYQVVDFLGREGELGLLSGLCEELQPGALLIHGDGGVGKTRLLIEFTRRLREELGFVAGFVRSGGADEVLDDLFAEGAPRLLVLDYAEDDPSWVVKLLSRLEETPNRQVHLVLLGRVSPEWDDEPPDRKQLMERWLPRARRHELGPIAVDPKEMFVHASACYARKLGVVVPTGVPDLSIAHYRRVLYVQMHALLAVDSDRATLDIESPATLLDGILALEQRHWARALEGVAIPADHRPEWIATLRRILGMATLIGGADSADQVGEWATADGHHADPEWRHVQRALRRLYPGRTSEDRTTHLCPLEPDILGEHLVLELWSEDRGQCLVRSVESTGPLGHASAMVVITRALLRSTEFARPDDARDCLLHLLHSCTDQLVSPALSVAMIAGPKVGDLVSGFLQNHGGDRHAEIVLSEVHGQSVSLMDAIHWAELRRAQKLERENAKREDLAAASVGLSISYSRLGGRENAIRARELTEEAVAIYRELAAERPDAFRPDLAGSLNNLGNRLDSLGRREEALGAAEEAVAIRRELAAERPDAFRPDLAGSLNNLGNRLDSLGRREEALGAAEEAVAIRRELAAERPDAFRPDLAGSLNNLGNRLDSLGRREEALGAAEEAVAIRRELAAERPDAFRPDLAASLNNLGSFLDSLGRREEALGAAEEAVAIYRELAAERPDAFRPDLAMSLNNLGGFLNSLGRREEALGAAEEAVAIYRELAAERPDAFRPDLAMSLNNLGNFLDSLGRREEALGAAEEAVAIYRELAAERPDAFRPDLAASLNNLGSFLDSLGRREEALGAAEEAVAIRRELAAERPDAFRPDLAASLNNLGSFLDSLGRREEALGAAEEAVAIYRELAAERPDAFRPDLAASLNNLGGFLDSLGRREEALGAAEEAVAIYRELAAERPDAFRPDLAMSFGTLGNALESLDRKGEALAAIEEAVETLSPAFLFQPMAHARWMGLMVKQYLERSEVLGQAADMRMLTPVLEVFQRMQAEAEGGSS